MRLALFLMAFASGIRPLLAADIPAISSIDAVTVFPQGAEVRRLAKVRIVAGTHTLIIPDLPAQAQPASIRVEGKASGRLEIGSVDSRRLSVPRGNAEVTASNRRRIETEIEKLHDDRAGIAAEQQAAEAQRTFITNLLQLPNRPAPSGNSTAAGEDWSRPCTTQGARRVWAEGSERIIAPGSAGMATAETSIGSQSTARQSSRWPSILVIS